MPVIVRNRPFTLLGYRFARGLFDERVAEREGQLYLIVTPQAPIVSDHSAQDRKVVELVMRLAIVHSTNETVDDLTDEGTAFGPDAVLAVKFEAGYISKSPQQDGDLDAFNDMMQHAVEQLYQVVRSKAISLAADSGFDASNIPVEIASDVLFEPAPADVNARAEAPSKHQRTRTSKKN